VTNPIEQLLLASAAGSRFPPNSRYHAIRTLHWTSADGRVVRYLGRRFIPQPESLATLGYRRVLDGDRLDRIAAERFGDPEQFWRIADANAAMRPADLTSEPGSMLRIAQPGRPGGAGG
jgi:hypothetical protein